ncbi:GNAT family N-acetyltransferase [Candidatus Woesearchaeota archaeon]|nr:GNAT family N-acetyltransferase [Candidatus Woesearchaeota archaeon]
MKVAIRKIRFSDLNDFRNCLNDKEIVSKLDDEDIKYPFTLKLAKKSLKKCIKDKECHMFAILVDGEYAGVTVLENPTVSKKCYELGYVVCRRFWKKGVATKAVKLMVGHGFKKMKIKKIWAGVLSNNPASKKVLEKCGFKLEGRLRMHTYKNGKYFDDLIYGLIRR